MCNLYAHISFVCEINAWVHTVKNEVLSQHQCQLERGVNTTPECQRNTLVSAQHHKSVLMTLPMVSVAPTVTVSITDGVATTLKC